MSVFWMLAGSMTLIALLFVLPPLFRSRPESTVDRDQLNTEVIKDHLGELRADLEAGKLDEEAYMAARRDLERELLDDLGQSTETEASAVRTGRWIGVVLVVLVPALAFAIYQQIGAQGIIPRLAAGASVAQPGSPQAQQQHSMEELVQKLAERMRSEPDNLEGWVMLARSYASMKRFKDAADAYAQAYRLAGDQPDLLADYADVLVTASGGEFSDQVGELLDKALAQQPQNLKALWLRGHWKFQRADYSGAINDWQRVAGLLPPADENAVVIAQQIQLARNKLAQSGAVPDVEDVAGKTAVPAAAAGIQVEVTLDPALQGRAAAEDTVFVFARAVQGPKMPLAIVRKQVKDLPLTVTLDDSQAMSPAMVLSSFAEVTVGARISRTGQAMPASGDLQGSLSPVATGSDQQVQLTIDQVVP